MNGRLEILKERLGITLADFPVGMDEFFLRSDEKPKGKRKKGSIEGEEIPEGRFEYTILQPNKSKVYYFQYEEL